MPKIPAEVSMDPTEFKPLSLTERGNLKITGTTTGSTRTQPSTVYIGIDPGQAGGLVALFSSGKIEATPMPETELGIWQWFDSIRRNNCHTVIEKVHSMPEQGVASSFKFGWGYGQLRMALIAAGIPFEEVMPKVWQKALAIPPKKKDEGKPQWKTRLLAFAQQLFPALPLWSEKKAKGKQLAVADAILIAEFCKRKQEGKL